MNGARVRRSRRRHWLGDRRDTGVGVIYHRPDRPEEVPRRKSEDDQHKNDRDV